MEFDLKISGILFLMFFWIEVPSKFVAELDKKPVNYRKKKIQKKLDKFDSILLYLLENYD